MRSTWPVAWLRVCEIRRPTTHWNGLGLSSRQDENWSAGPFSSQVSGGFEAGFVRLHLERTVMQDLSQGSGGITSADQVSVRFRTMGQWIG